ncbi:hypothetical protein [Exiguobacterium sp. s78]|uniref:hypothetical protein n=1 Tax=Exiguobacterium sp. s78 TaxID=2751197 RepID=UPI001BEC22C1|nr:hypothetical protein [Exiguobacterium sp. s78]
MTVTKSKKVSVSVKRQLAIPKEIYDAAGIGKEIMMELEDGVIKIKPIHTNTDDFSHEILSDILKEGYQGEDILKEFDRRKKMIRPAISSMIDEALGSEPVSIEDMFKDEEKD